MNCDYKYSDNSSCSAEIYDQESNKCIFHCKKDKWLIDSNNRTWNTKRTDDFWEEIRAAIKDNGNHFIIFRNFEFPDINIDIFSAKRTKEKKLLNDYYFWYKDDIMEFDKYLSFENCIFYKLTFFDITCESISFSDSTIYESLEISSMSMESLNIEEINNECILELNSVKTENCHFSEINISTLELSNCNFKDLSIIESKFEELFFHNLMIQKGSFIGFSVDEIINRGFSVANKEEFIYLGVDVKKASRSYYGYLKSFYTDKKDYINADDMYQKEMNRYFYDTYTEIINKKNIISNLQNLVVTGFGKVSSNFGKSWIRPLLLIILTSFLSVYWINDYSLSYCLSGSCNLLDKMVQIFYLKDKNSFGLAELISKVILGLLVYQLVMSIKRKNKY